MEEKTIKILIWIIIILYFIISAITKNKKTTQSQVPTMNKTSPQRTSNKSKDLYTKTNNLPQKEKLRSPIKIEEETGTLEKIINENEDRTILKEYKENKKEEKKQRLILTKRDIKKAVVLSDIIKPKYF